MTVALPSYSDPPFHVKPDIVLDLPRPPSVNRIWRAQKAGKKRVSISPEYDAWKRQADKMIMATGAFRGIKCIKGKFEVEIVIQRCRGDVDNRCKAVLDFLQSRGVVEDDKNCERVTVGWGEAPAGARVTVR